MLAAGRRTILRKSRATIKFKGVRYRCRKNHQIVTEYTSVKLKPPIVRWSKYLENAKNKNSDEQSGQSPNERDAWLKRRATRWRNIKNAHCKILEFVNQGTSHQNMKGRHSKECQRMQWPTINTSIEFERVCLR